MLDLDRTGHEDLLLIIKTLTNILMRIPNLKSKAIMSFLSCLKTERQSVFDPTQFIVIHTILINSKALRCLVPFQGYLLTIRSKGNQLITCQPLLRIFRYKPEKHVFDWHKRIQR